MQNVSLHQSTTKKSSISVAARNVLAVILLCTISHAGYAGVIVTPATGGTNICSTVATAPTTLGAIKIMEGLMTDYNSGSGSFTITPPTGWSFVVSLPTVTASAGGDLSIGVYSISAGALSINFNASGTTHFDTITITNLRVTAATSSSATGNITASTVLGIAGITAGSAGTNFGTLSILAATVPSVSIIASPGDTICTGGAATFTPTPVSGGTTPTYQWYVNGSFVGSGGIFSSGVLVTGSKVHCRLTASGCVLPATALSNTVTMTAVAAPTAVTVSGGGTFCSSAILTAANGGSGTIFFQGTTSGGMSKVLGGTPQTVTSSGSYYFNATAGGGCWGTEGMAVVTINPVATANAGSPLTICAGDSATLAGSIGGSATTSIWSAPSGTFSNPASLTSKYTPSIASGAVTLTLTTVGPCAPATSTVVATVNDCGLAGVNNVISESIHVYPNPVTDMITIDASVAVNIKMVNQLGKIVLEQKKARTFDVSSLAQGLYIMMVYDESNILLKTFKIAKSE